MELYLWSFVFLEEEWSCDVSKTISDFTRRGELICLISV